LRKYVVLGLALLLMLSLTPVAFAHSGSYGYFSGNSGWVSDGHHGRYWSGDFDGRVVVDWDSYFDHVFNRDKHKNWYHGGFRYYDKTDGEWYYYKDDNGITHYYFAGDDENNWKYHSYVDEYGNTQYSRTKVVRVDK